MLSRLARRCPLAWRPLAAQPVPFIPLPHATCMVVVRTLAKGKDAKGKEAKSKGNASASAADSSEDGAASGASFTEKDLEDLKQQMDRPFFQQFMRNLSGVTGAEMGAALFGMGKDAASGSTSGTINRTRPTTNKPRPLITPPDAAAAAKLIKEAEDTQQALTNAC